METIHQETQPLISIEKQKLEAGEYVAHAIKVLMNDGELNHCAAAQAVYETVKGNDYRKEQAAIKLLELLDLEDQVRLRQQEIRAAYPAMDDFINQASIQSVANDEKYLVAA